MKTTNLVLALFLNITILENMKTVKADTLEAVAQEENDDESKSKFGFFI